jgi:hypothetical protein
MNHMPAPNHYSIGGLETIDILRAKLTRDEFRGFLLGNVLKYLLRHQHKGTPMSDLEKAAVYLQWLQDEMAKTHKGSAE